MHHQRTVTPKTSEREASVERTMDKATTTASALPLVKVEMQNVSYHPQVAHGKKNERIQVLKNISTTISPCKLTAWMGPSGSGKTSLISVAAHMTQPGDLSAESRVLVNGEPGFVPKRLVGVVWQDDLLLSNLTVQENLYYAARLKTRQDVQETVQTTMKTLGLLDVQHMRVGNPAARGISGGQRKRVAVGAELVVRPALLLLDEPTSGLDATTAQSLMQTLKELSTTAAVVVVIHQPRTAIYNLLDHLLLLSQGHVVYDGPPGQARRYLEQVRDLPLPPETGLADWLMDSIREEEDKSDGHSFLAKEWNEHQKTLLNEEDTTPVAVDGPHQYTLDSLKELHSGPRYYTSRWTQLKLLTVRSMKQQRGERLTMTAVLLQSVYLAFTALFWWRLENTTGRIFERNSLLFFMVIGQANGIVVVAVNVFQQERTLLKRERAKKLYAVSSYFLARTVTDMTHNVLLPVLYTMAVYWVCGFRASAAAYFKNALAFYWTFSTAQSMGLFMSVLIPIPQMALILAPPITLFFVILGGFYIPYENLHAGVSWISFASFARYGYSALIINEYQGRDIPCATDTVAIVIGGSDECPLPGQAVLSDLGIEGFPVESYWFNILMMVLLQVFFRIGAYGLLRKSR